MRDFHFLETEVQVTMDLIGSCWKTWVRISGGRESHIGSLSDIAACYCFLERQREGLELRLQRREIEESGYWVGTMDKGVR